nr:uncharacterized mitochondrial protein AtMg00810-like [Tanacetum cinerariifolium]
MLHTPQQNGVDERQNRTLVEAARTMMIYSIASLFLWAEAINTACYTQNRSLIRHRYNKMPYDLMQDKKPDLSFLHVFRALYYPTNDNEDLAAALRDEVLADSPMSTCIDQYAPLISISSSQEQEHSPIIYQGFEESPKTPTFHDDPLNESPYKDSTSQGSSSNSKYASEFVKKYGMHTTDSVDTPMVEKSKLDEDLQGKPVNATLYRGMIGCHMYLTSSRLDLVYAVSLCARYQAKPAKKHLQVVKRIFRYLKGTINMGLIMSSITAQQTKLDLELVPKENRLDIGKCNRRIPPFLITADVPEVYMHQFWNFVELGHTGVINSLNDVVVDLMHKTWRTFAALINRGLSGKISGLDKLHLSRAQILWGVYYQKNVDCVELLWKDFIYHIDNRVYKKQEKMMHTSKDDYVINTLRFLSAKESTQIYGKLFLETLTSPEMKESKAYKTYLGYASGDVPPKIAKKFKKASSSKKDSSLVPADDEPAKKGKRVKRSAKKSTTTPATGIVISEAPVETQSKRKEKVDVARGKGIELLSEVALAEKVQMKDVRKKSLREFHRTHPSGSGMIVETPLSIEKIKSLVTSEGTGDNPGVPDVTKDDLTESESESWGNDVDDSNDENDSENEGNKEENKSDDGETPFDNEKVKDDDEKEDEFAHTPPNTDDKQDANLESKNDDKIECDEDRGMDVMTNQFNDDEKENLEITQEQVLEDAHVTILTVVKETEVPDAKIVSPLDVYVHHEVPRTHTSTLLTVPISVIPESSPVCTTIPQSSQTFTSPLLLTTPTPPPRTETTNTPSTIPDFASVFRFNERVIALEKDECYDGLIKSYNLDKDFFSSYDVYSLKRRRKDKDKDEVPSAGSDRGFKKRKTSKDTEPTTELPEFKVADTDMPQNQGGNMGNDDDEPKKSLPLNKNLIGRIQKAGTIYLISPNPFLYKVGNRQKVPADYFFNNDHKYLQGGISTMTYTTFLTKTKAAHYDLPVIEDMVLNIWSPIKVALDRYAKWGISHWRDQRKTFYAYAQGLGSTHDVYSIKRILAMTRVDVMKKHGYGYLREIEVRRADNMLYKFKEGDFPRLRLNDIGHAHFYCLKLAHQSLGR